MLQASPYAIALSHFPNFNSRTYAHLFERYADFETIWQLTKEEFLSIGLQTKTIDKFLTWKQAVSPKELAQAISNSGLQTVDRTQSDFPAQLKTIFDPPILLYVLGQLPRHATNVGLVGARDASPYGLRTAKRLATELASAGLIPVSGLARGIDTQVHLGAIGVNRPTIAVVAHGLKLLPTSKAPLVNSIIANGGGVISEQPPNFKAEKYHFPIRNRIIAGLCQGVVIIEAKLPSGSLITAQAALNTNRDVLAVPGPIDAATSAGTNKLIQDGAHVATSAQDVLSVLGLQKPNLQVLQPITPTPDSQEEAQVIQQLSLQTLHVNDLARQTQLPIQTILATLSIMELSGKVKNLGNQSYSL